MPSGARCRAGRARKGGRAEREAGRDVRPIEHADELRRLVEAARSEGLETYVFVLLLLDAGLRVGEALGIRWRAITWGDEEDDRRRALLIDTNRPRGGEAEPPRAAGRGGSSCLVGSAENSSRSTDSASALRRSPSRCAARWRPSGTSSGRASWRGPTSATGA